MRVRETASFGENGKDREDVINLVTLLAVRNPRTREEMNSLYTQLIRAMLLLTFEEKGRWDSWVEAQKATGEWPADTPADYEGHKKYVEENIEKLKVHKNLTLETELNALETVYPYFDKKKWRIVKAGQAAGGFVTTDHPVCVHRSGGLNYGQQFAPGLGLCDRDVLFPLSSTVALIGREEGDEDVIEIGKHGVASFNASVMGYAMKQIYARDDQYFYTRPAGQPLGRGFNLLDDPNLRVRED